MTEAAQGGLSGVQSFLAAHRKLVAAVSAALVAGVLAWLVAGDYEDLSSTKREGGAGVASIPLAKAVGVSVAQLKSVADSLGYPVYWTGPERGDTYELTHMADGRVFLRYLPSGVAVGDLRSDFGFIATYPDSNAYERVRRAARKKGAIVRKIRGGGIAVADKNGGELVRSTARPLPTPPVFFAAPGSKVLVEVYDADDVNQALRTVTSGRLRPVR